MDYANGNQTQAGAVISCLTKQKLLRRHKEGHYIPVKWTIQQDDKIIANIYDQNISVPNYIKQKLLHSHKGSDRS